MFISYAVASVFVISLLIAAVIDCRRFSIPNSISVIIGIDFIAAAACLPVHTQWTSHLGAAATVFAVGLVLFRFRVLGAGDIKLMTAVSLWAGFEKLSWFLLCSAIAGGALSLTIVLFRYLVLAVQLQFPRACVLSIPRLLRIGENIPYGVAIAAGGLSLLFELPHLLVG